MEEYTQERAILVDSLDAMRRPFGFIQAYYQQENVFQNAPPPAGPDGATGGLQAKKAEAMKQLEEIQEKALAVEKQA